MNDELSFEVLLCAEYERLLNECQDALDHWNERSESIRLARQTGKESGGELLRLQARFAKAYNNLQRHVGRCERCELAARMTRSVAEAEARSYATQAN